MIQESIMEIQESYVNYIPEEYEEVVDREDEEEVLYFYED